MPKTLRQLLEDSDWTFAFHPRALERGSEYADQHRVTVISLEPHRLTSTCRGSGDNNYTQHIRVKGSEHYTSLDTTCTCPVGFDCKHCVAALFSLMDLPEEPTGAQGEQLSPTLERWLERLTVAAPDAEKPAGQSARTLMYELEFNSSGNATITPYKCKRLKNGRFTDLRPILYPHEILRQNAAPQENDAKFLRLVVARTPPGALSSGVPLEGSEGAELLEHALATGRLFLPGDEEPLKPGPPLTGEFRWEKLEGEQYRGCWYHKGKMLKRVLALQPLHYVEAEQGRVGLLSHDYDEMIASSLAMAPPVPESQVVSFSQRIQTLNRQIPTPRTLSETIIDGIAPTPHLILGSHEFSAYVPQSGRMQRQHQHRAALSFVYDGIRASGRQGTEVTRLDGNTNLRIQRQAEAEKLIRLKLLRLGFKVATRQSKALPESAGELLELATEGAWLRFMLNDVPSLREQGWEIEYTDDFAFNLAEVDNWYAHIDEASGRDWFDLEVGIEVNGQRLSLLPILLNVLRAHPELLNPAQLNKRRDDESLLLQIPAPQGEVRRNLQVALPYGRLKPVLATLGDFYLREPGEASVRLPTLDATRLNALEDIPLNWQGGEQMRNLGERLRDIRRQPAQVPAGLNATLRSYQLEGLSWMQALRELEVGGILADDMGLGKTLQTLAHLLTEKNAGRLTRPAMVVMPTSLIPNWQDEAARFAPGLRVLALQGLGRRKQFDKLEDYDLLLTTYALLPKDLEHFKGLKLHVLILDEAQYIKSPGSKAAQAARQLEARQRLCLSGTPLENHLGELWSLFHFLLPGWLGDAKTFNRDYRTPIERQGNNERLQHLNARIKPFLLRRTKEQVATELPAKTEMIHWVELSDAQRDVYETMRLAMDQKVRAEITRKGVARSQIIILEALLKLRQVCCDLRLVNSEASTARGAHSGKLTSLMEMLEELLAEGRRVLLFSQFTSMLRLIEAELEQRGIAYALLTGETRDRRAPVQDFQNGRLQIFLISLKAGGVGLNLTAADTVIHYDPWWNPAAENQATDRAYRIGQEKPVFVYKLITRGTVEEKIQQLQQEKSALAAGVLDGRQAGDWRLAAEDIDALFAPLPGPRKG
ncbi:helicase SNF2 [Pseudomonas sp. MYb187]|uniref:DEAD/DEAH box helicase n=1 Tax=Pseudomonas TaxID=286 RepID=UPI000CFD9535|nr:DEAD/DEAH box helicase [Pseudomonas sp. MYb187]PRA60896.1 helicase SNF2 [Pseudomonas sp. MYb187]